MKIREYIIKALNYIHKQLLILLGAYEDPAVKFARLLEQIQTIYLYKGRCMQLVAGSREEEVFVEFFPKLLHASGLLNSEYLDILKPLFPTLTTATLSEWMAGENLPYDNLRAGLLSMLVEYIEHEKFGIVLVRC